MKFTPQKVTMYKATDGQLFDTMEGAEQHQRHLTREAQLEKLICAWLWTGERDEDLVKEILANRAKLLDILK